MFLRGIDGIIDNYLLVSTGQSDHRHQYDPYIIRLFFSNERVNTMVRFKNNAFIHGLNHLIMAEV